MAGQLPRKTITLIATVLNEARGIEALLDSMRAQTRQPDEIVVVDGGSRDATMDILRQYSSELPLRIIEAPGANISQGRNRAIEAARGELIASTDAGVRLDPAWLNELARPLEGDAKGKAVAAGFFLADAPDTFTLAMGATVLPAMEEVRPDGFLPSSRSIAFPKDAWRAVGGYPEWLDYCEDLVFDLALLEAGYRFVWTPRAVVHFRPRSNLRSFFIQYYRYARGDGKAGLWPRRHAARYAAYAAAAGAVAGGVWIWPLWLLLPPAAAFHLYVPCRRVLRLRGTSPRQRLAAACWVPLIRVTGDVAKMLGYPDGRAWRLRNRGRAQRKER